MRIRRDARNIITLLPLALVVGIIVWVLQLMGYIHISQ